jgi:hypothetical protein
MSRRRRSGQHQAAIDHDDAAGHVAGSIRGEEKERAVEIVRRAEATLRDALSQPLAASVARKSRLISVSM